MTICGICVICASDRLHWAIGDSACEWCSRLTLLKVIRRGFKTKRSRVSETSRRPGASAVRHTGVGRSVLELFIRLRQVRPLYNIRISVRDHSHHTEDQPSQAVALRCHTRVHLHAQSATQRVSSLSASRERPCASVRSRPTTRPALRRSARLYCIIELVLHLQLAVHLPHSSRSRR